MSDNGNDPTAEGQRPDQDFGVLGNLPRTRPSVRSPRRSVPAEAAAPEPEPAATSASTPTPQPAQQTSSTAELEALARTGIAIAGGAASLGLRLAGRAAAAVRGAVDRS